MQPNAINPRRGEVWTVELDPTRGREQAGTRPVLIVSSDGFNDSPRDLVIIAPITGTGRGFMTHVPVVPPEAGLTKPSQVMTEQVRSISKDRLVRRLGMVAPGTMGEVDERIRLVLGL